MPARSAPVTFLVAAATLSLSASPGAARAQSLVYEGNDGGAGIVVSGLGLADGNRAHPALSNPVIRGNNLYAPDLVRNGGAWNLYYGGWARDGDTNDRIYFAVSDDLLPDGEWSGQVPVIDHGGYLHVNDPSVQRRAAGDWVMAYTVAGFVGSDFRDWIAISTSSDGAAWTPSAGTASTEIEIEGASFSDVARPSLVWTGNGWRLWFDGRIDNGPIHSYVAESSDELPRRFQLIGQYADAESFPAFFEPDVELIDGRYVAVIQRNFNRFEMFVSDDGANFRGVGEVLDADEPTFGRRHVSNPGLLYDATAGAVLGVAFGMTDSPSLVGHDVGFAYTQLRPLVTSCPETVHGFAVAEGFDRARVSTFGFDSFCRLQIVDPRNGEVLLDRAIDGRAGDRFRFAGEVGGGALAPATSGSELTMDPPPAEISGGCSTAPGSGAPLGLEFTALVGAWLLVRRRDRAEPS